MKTSLPLEKTSLYKARVTSPFGVFTVAVDSTLTDAFVEIRNAFVSDGKCHPAQIRIGEIKKTNRRILSSDTAPFHPIKSCRTANGGIWAWISNREVRTEAGEVVKPKPLPASHRAVFKSSHRRTFGDVLEYSLTGISSAFVAEAVREIPPDFGGSWNSDSTGCLRLRHSGRILEILKNGDVFISVPSDVENPDAAARAFYLFIILTAAGIEE
jgi:hypothetical protein